MRRTVCNMPSATTHTRARTQRHTNSLTGTHTATETQRHRRGSDTCTQEHRHTQTHTHPDAMYDRTSPTHNMHLAVYMHLAVNMHRSQRGEPDCITAHTACLFVLERCAQQGCVPLFDSSEDEVRCAGGYNDRKRGGKKRCSARTDDAPPQVAAAVCDHLNGPGQAHRSTRPTSPSW